MKGFKASAMAAAFALAGMALAADGSLKIDRSVDSKTLTISYAGARAALAELRINGKSAATRSLSDTRSSGEATFALNPASLEDGDNTIEVRLYSADGDLLVSEKSTVSVDRSATGPARLSAPRTGDTVQGPVRIKLDLDGALDGSYVSFFVNDTFAALLNRGPYQFTWDTQRAANGWHEIQAVVVDQRNNTFKTQRLRLYVDNAGGRTFRDGSVMIANPLAGLAAGSHVTALRGAAATQVGTPSQAAMAMAAQVVGAPNPISAEPAAMAGTKPVGAPSAAAAGTQDLLPTAPSSAALQFSRASEELMAARIEAPSIPINVGPTTAPPMALIVISAGKRLPGVGAFNVMMDGSPVKFDVQPRVEQGVPVTPFRHLFEHGGGKVRWGHQTKEIAAEGMGRSVWMQVGNIGARVDGQEVELEMAPFIESSRVMVPMSFLSDALNLSVRFDPKTGHVLVERGA